MLRLRNRTGTWSVVLWWTGETRMAHLICASVKRQGRSPKSGCISTGPLNAYTKQKMQPVWGHSKGKLQGHVEGKRSYQQNQKLHQDPDWVWLVIPYVSPHLAAGFGCSKNNYNNSNGCDNSNCSSTALRALAVCWTGYWDYLSESSQRIQGGTVISPALHVKTLTHRG